MGDDLGSCAILYQPKIGLTQPVLKRGSGKHAPLRKPLRADLLAIVQHVGRIGGLMEGLPDGVETEPVLDLMIAEAMKTSEIEGESLEYGDVMSSIRNRLGLNPTPEPVKSRLAQGAGELMVAVRERFADPLEERTLHEWHEMLLAGSSPLRVGAWRRGSDPMQVDSGRIDRPTIHYETPPSQRVPHEMEGFILRKSKFFQRYGNQLNERQSKVIRKMFAAGPGGFEGGINVCKYLPITRTSKATATRDLQHLALMGALAPVGSGRATRYEIRL